MEKEEKAQRKDEKEKSWGGCCDFSSAESQGMVKMMREFCDGDEKDSLDCRSMMKEMMKSMSSISDEKNKS